MGADRSAIHCRSRRPEEGATRHRLRELVTLRRHFGYQRLNFLLGRDGYVMDHKRFRRLCQEEGLQVRKRAGSCYPDYMIADWHKRLEYDCGRSRRLRAVLATCDQSRHCGTRYGSAD